MKKKKLARTRNLDGSGEVKFELPPLQIISVLTDYPDGTCTAELTSYGKMLFGWHTEENFLKLLQNEAQKKLNKA